MVNVAFFLLCTFVPLFLLLVCDDSPSKLVMVGIGITDTYFIFFNTIFKLEYFILHKSTESKKKIVFSKQMTKENSSSPVVALQHWQSSQPSSLGRCLFVFYFTAFMAVLFLIQYDNEEHIIYIYFLYYIEKR